MPRQVKILFAVVLALVLFNKIPDGTISGWLNLHDYNKDLANHYSEYENGKISAAEMLVFCDHILQERKGKGPEAVSAYAYRSFVYRDEHDFDQALVEAQKSLAVPRPHPVWGSGWGYLALGSAYENLGRRKEAADAYQILLDNKAFVITRIELVRRIHGLRDNVIHDARKLCEDFVSDRYWASEPYKDKYITVRGKFVRASATSEKNRDSFLLFALEGHPTGSEVVCHPAKAWESTVTKLKEGQEVVIFGFCMGLGDSGEDILIDDAQIIAVDTPSIQDLYARYAQYADHKVSASEMLAFCDQVLQEAGEGRSLQAMYACIIRRLVLAENDVEDALAAARKAVEVSPPEIMRAYVALGDALNDVGRLDEAADAYEQAVKDYPSLEPHIRELRAAVVYDALTFETEFLSGQRANLAKNGASITVRGELLSIEEVGGNLSLVLKGVQPSRDITCTFSQKDSQSVNLKVGQKVTIYGDYEGALPGIQLGSSRIVKIEP